MSKLNWFKHYNNASIGSSISKLRAERDFETIACYWMLLELISQHEDRETKPGFIEIPHKLLHQTWNVSTQRAVRIVSKIVPNFVKTISIVRLEQTYQVFCYNWLELQETRGGKRSAKKLQKSGEVRSEKREERVKGVLPSAPPARFCWFSDRYKNKHGRYPSWNDKMRKTLAKLDNLTDAEFEMAVNNFFADGREYYRKQGYQLHCLVNDIDQHLIAKEPDAISKQLASSRW